MTDGFTLGLAQLEIEPANTETNVARAIEAIERASNQGVDLLVLPELFTVGYFSFDSYTRTAEGLSGPTLTRLREAAAASEIALLAGTIVEDLAETAAVETPADSGFANTATLFDADGTLKLVYRKHHLFGYGSAEQELLVPGTSVDVATIGPFTVGVSTCYDLRFPELYRQQIDAGATLLLVPSAWPYPRIEHWETLSRARAVENQCFLAAANGAGAFEEATLLGRSTVYDPWGVTLASSGDESTLVTATIDPDAVERVRTAFPALSDRRL